MAYTYPMVRIQLHLTEQQDRKLRAMARRVGLTRAELIRRGVELLLREDHGRDDALLELAGAAGPAIAPDLSERHDEVLYRPEELSLPMAAQPGSEEYHR